MSVGAFFAFSFVFGKWNARPIGFRSRWLTWPFHTIPLPNAWVSFAVCLGPLSICTVKRFPMNSEAFGWILANDIAWNTSEFILLLSLATLRDPVQDKKCWKWMDGCCKSYTVLLSLMYKVNTLKSNLSLSTNPLLCFIQLDSMIGSLMVLITRAHEGHDYVRKIVVGFSSTRFQWTVTVAQSSGCIVPLTHYPHITL